MLAQLYFNLFKDARCMCEAHDMAGQPKPFGLQSAYGVARAIVKSGGRLRLASSDSRQYYYYEYYANERYAHILKSFEKKSD